MQTRHGETHRTNITLFLDDAIWLETHHGRGWTNHVREIVHSYVLNKKALANVVDHEPITTQEWDLDNDE